MLTLAQNIDNAEATIQLAHVAEPDGSGRLFVYNDDHRLRATVAPSCLIMPQSKDRVLIAVSAHGECFVLAVLETASTDVMISAPAGRVNIAAKDGVAITTPGKVEVVSDEVSLIGNKFNTFFEHVSQKAKRMFRFISGSEHVRAERMDYVTKRDMSFKAKNAVVTAEDLVKIDGEQIHMG